MFCPPPVKSARPDSGKGAATRVSRKFEVRFAWVVTPEMLTIYCAQRADLRGYHGMLEAWRKEAPMPEMQAGIDRMLLALDEIEADSKAVLEILGAALDAAFWTRAKSH